MSAGIAVRADLLELTPEALTALANAGFVKRAQKDVAAGLLPRLEGNADGTVTASFDDGVRTSLPPGRTLRDAQCSCPASGMCRHRVMLVLAYQAQAAASAPSASAASDGAPPSATDAPTEADAAWSPAQFDDAALAASLAPSVLEQAGKLALARPVVGVQAWRSASAPPVARLPMCSVRFFSRSSLVHARCDCKQGSGCAHVAIAVWAFRQAGPLAPGSAEAMVEVLPPASAGADSAAPPAQQLLMQGDAARAFRAQIDALLLSLWLDGSSQPLMALAARFEAVRAQARALGWNWVDDVLDELWQLLQAQQARSSRFEPLRLVRVLAELWARLQAAAHAEQPRPSERPALLASQILGLGVKGEVALDHLRLVSLGAQLWSDDTEEGASVLFADPDTQNVTVLERQWSRAADAAAGGTAQALTNRRVAGFPLRQLASGQVITKTATRRANGLVDIAAGARQTGVLPLSPSSWNDLVAPLRQDSVAALVAHLREAPPDFVRPRQAASGASAGASGQLHVVAFERMAVVSCHWDAAAQVLHAALAQAAAAAEGDADADADDAPDPSGATGGSERSERRAPPEQLHLALPHRAVAPGAVDALARSLAGEYGALRAVAGTVHLQGGVAVMQPLSLLTAQRAVVLQVEAVAPQPLGLNSDIDDVPALNALAGDTLELLALWLRQGLRHQGGGALSRAEGQVQRLKQAGLDRGAALLGAVLENLRSAQRPALVAQLAMLGLLMQGVVQGA